MTRLLRAIPGTASVSDYEHVKCTHCMYAAEHFVCPVCGGNKYLFALKTELEADEVANYNYKRKQLADWLDLPDEYKFKCNCA